MASNAELMQLDRARACTRSCTKERCLETIEMKGICAHVYLCACAYENTCACGECGLGAQLGSAHNCTRLCAKASCGDKLGRGGARHQHMKTHIPKKGWVTSFDKFAENNN